MFFTFYFGVKCNLDLFLWDTLVKNLHLCLQHRCAAELTWLCLCCRRSLWCPPVRPGWRFSLWDPLNCDSCTWWPVYGLWRGCRSFRCKKHSEENTATFLETEATSCVEECEAAIRTAETRTYHSNMSNAHYHSQVWGQYYGLIKYRT